MFCCCALEAEEGLSGVTGEMVLAVEGIGEGRDRREIRRGGNAQGRDIERQRGGTLEVSSITQSRLRRLSVKKPEKEWSSWDEDVAGD